jgi:hypothetical protein
MLFTMDTNCKDSCDLVMMQEERYFSKSSGSGGSDY